MGYDPLAALEANMGRKPTLSKQQQRQQQSNQARIGWAGLLSPFGVSLLSRMGWYRQDLPTDKNPVTEALKSPDFVQQFGKMSGFSRAAVSI